MKNYQKTIRTTFYLLTSLLFFIGCISTEQNSESVKTDSTPPGVKAPAKYFTGNAYVEGMVDNDTIFTTQAGSVTFEPQARSNWHSHPSGQILIVTEGVGYHQIKGQKKEIIRKGDVIKCPPNKIHWHGGSSDSSMTHIYIVPNTEKGIVNWMEAVTDEEFTSK